MSCIKQTIDGVVRKGVQAQDVSIVDSGDYYVEEDVEGALQEIGAGTTLDSRYVEITGDTMTGPLILEDNLSVGTNSPSGGFSGVGDIYATSGIKAMEGLYSEAVAYGAGLEIADNSQSTTYTNVMYSDATMVGATRTITDSHASFTDAYLGQFFKVISSDPSFTGATGEIIAVPSSTTLILSFGSSAEDVIPDASAMSFVIYPHPRFYVSDNGDFHASVGINDDASFKIIAETLNNEHALHIVATAGVDNICGVAVELNPTEDYGGASGYCLSYDARDFAGARMGTGLDIILDNAGATGGDFHGIDIALSDPANADMEVEAVATHEGVDPIAQYLGTPASLAAAFSYDTDTFNDRTAAFGSSGTNVEIFSSDDDFIYLASLAKFDEINVLLATPASTTVAPKFRYVTDAGTWVEFTPSDDTSGFQQNGTIRFDSGDLTTWGQQTIFEVTGAGDNITDYYWVRIKRLRNNVSTPPVESTIKVTTTGTKHIWDKEGRLGIKTFNQSAEPDTDDLPAGRFCFWTETDDSKLYICYNHGGVVKTTELI